MTSGNSATGLPLNQSAPVAAENLVRVIERNATCFRQYKVAAAPFEEIVAKGGFERPDLRRDRRLRDVERARGPGQRAVPGHGAEEAQVMQVECRHNSTIQNDFSQYMKFY